MDKFYRYFKQFAIMSICYIVTVFIVKIVELLINACVFGSLSGVFYGNLVSCGFVAALVFLLYCPVSFFSKKAATYISSVVFGIMILTETGLCIYYANTGILMGKELIVRPLWEMVHTVKSAMSLWIIVGAVLLLVAYVILSVRIAKKDLNKLTTSVVALVILISTPVFFIINTNQDKIVVNKTFYCVRQCLRSDFDVTTSENGTDIIKKYIAMFPEREVIDNEYPLERKDNIGNVLGPYFKKSDVKPNIVVVVVESLGYDLFGDNEGGVCFTPFLDSLSKHSLLWVNCMATTPRSFGAVPAVTGSVPHGLKGFQFGDIPNHNSLFTILAKNGYSTNAFYAGTFTFDRIYDYLVEQNIDYMSLFYSDYQDDKSNEKDGTYWGYHDDVMFQKSLQVIKQRAADKPALDLFVTISQHEDLNLCDKKRQKKYYDEAESLHSDPDLLGKMASTLYTDDALRHFVKGYEDAEPDGNYIFIITGDHSMNLDDSNPLDAYHVPLIIWSPLLEKPARFEGMVSHNDITPSVLALLRENFGIETPPTVSWVSDGLDTVSGFHSNIRNYFLYYSRELRDFVWNDYYYAMYDQANPVSHIVEGVKLENIDNQSLSKDLRDKLETMVYVDNYVYSNNKLTKSSILNNKDYISIKNVTIDDSLYCASLDEKPSVAKPKATFIYHDRFKEHYDKIKVVLNADVSYTGFVTKNASMLLVVDCEGDKMERVYSPDYFMKYILSPDNKPCEWYKLELSHVISVNNSDEFEIKIFLLPTHKDKRWNPDHTVTLKNVNINILGLKNQ